MKGKLAHRCFCTEYGYDSQHPTLQENLTIIEMEKIAKYDFN